jgi:hypothetical protein
MTRNVRSPSACASPRAANANIARWQMMDKFLTAHLAARDVEALGGDLAYQYRSGGALSGVGFDAAAAVLSSSQFATAPQWLQPRASLEQGPHRLAQLTSMAHAGADVPRRPGCLFAPSTGQMA